MRSKVANPQVGLALLAVLSLSAACGSPGEDLSPAVQDPRGPAERPEGLEPGQVLTPLGKLPAECVIEAAEGEDPFAPSSTGSPESDARCAAEIAKLRESRAPAAGSQQSYALQAPVQNGWVEAGAWTLPFAGGRIFSQLIVPAKPTRQGALVYLFSSLDGAGWIIQPVLQYGSNGAFGGPWWSFSNWVVGPNYSKFSKPLGVQPGHRLTGDVRSTRCYSSDWCLWSIVGHNWANGQETVLATGNLPPMRSAVGGALEAYNLSTCDQLPPSRSMTFDLISVFDTQGQWHRVPWEARSFPNAGPACNYGVSFTTLTQPGRVTLRF